MPEIRKTEMRMEGSGAFGLVGGMPLAEYREVRMSNCQRCQRNPEEAGRGVIIGMRVVDEVLEADCVCFGCLNEEERGEYQDVIDNA